MKLHEKEHNVFTKAHCNKIKRKFTTTRERRRRAIDETSKKRKRKWFDKLCAKKEKIILSHQQNVQKVIESQMKENVRRISNDERTQSLRDADVKNLQKASQTSW
jgi:hypothetical protein